MTTDVTGLIACDCVPLPGGLAHATRCAQCAGATAASPHAAGQVLVAPPGHHTLVTSDSTIALIPGCGGLSADAVGTTKVYAVPGVAPATAVVAVGLYQGVYVGKHFRLGLGPLSSGGPCRSVKCRVKFSC